MPPTPPPTIKAWQFTRGTGGLEANLRLNTIAPPQPKSTQHLVQVLACALNPVDYKPGEHPVLGPLLVRKPATPGIDFAGYIAVPASGSPLKRGQLVFGVASSPFGGGALSEFAVFEKETTVPVPEDVTPVDACTIGVAGLTAYQSIVPRVKKGDKVFINGGSGGTGIFGIQIAKAVGCHVTTTCSSANVELCRRLGADEVVDYTKGSVVEQLKKSGVKFDHVVDNVASSTDLFFQCHEFTKPEAVFVVVGGTPGFGMIADSLKRKYWPGFLGGGKRKVEGFFPKANYKDLEKLATWMSEGKVKPVIDSRFAFEQAPDAFRKLKTGRAKGKVVVDVALETHRNAWSE